MRLPARLSCLLLTTAALPAAAALPEGPPPTLATAWTLTAWSLLPLTALALVYVAGLARLRRAPESRDDITPRHVAAFGGGLLALVLALVWPLDAFGAYALSAHVAQHMTLLALAPPLLLGGHLAQVSCAAWPRAWADRLQAWLRPLAPIAQSLSLATVAHVATMLLWHLPGATAASLASEPVHRMMLASILLAGLWFWSAVWHRRSSDAGAVGGLVALVTVMMSMGFLGALLTFAPRLLYPTFTDRALLIGLDPLRDQQLAGLLMWVVSGAPHLVVGLSLVIALMRRVRGAAESPALR